MKLIRALILVVIIPAMAAAHPGGGLIALDANTVVFGDSMYNSVWRLEKGRKPVALMKNFHADWTTLGQDGHIYSEAFQEMGGALFRIDLSGVKHVKVAEESHVNQPVFAVVKSGELVFQKDAQIMQRAGSTGAMTPFRGNGRVAKGEPPLQKITAFAWAADGTLYLSDSYEPFAGERTTPADKGSMAARLRRVGKDGVVRFVGNVDGKMIEPRIWNSTGGPRIWSIAIDDRKRIYTALPDTGEVVRIDADGSQHVIDRRVGGWRVTAVATHGDSVFLLESSESTNAGQRVRVIRGLAKPELFGQVEP